VGGLAETAGEPAYDYGRSAGSTGVKFWQAGIHLEKLQLYYSLLAFASAYEPQASISSKYLSYAKEFFRQIPACQKRLYTRHFYLQSGHSQTEMLLLGPL